MPQLGQNLGVDNRCVKQMCTEQAIPHQIIFHRPAVFQVKRKAEGTVRIFGTCDPTVRHFRGKLSVLLRLVRIPQHVVKDAHSGNAHHRLERQIAVVRKMARKIVRAELIGRILPVFGKITCPLFQQIHVFAREGSVVRRNASRSGHQDHIAALFYRHLQIRVVASVHLTVQHRINAAIMRSKIESPLRTARKPQNRPQHAEHKFRVIQEKKRGRRVTDINGRGKPAGKALLGNKQHLAVPIQDALMRTDGLSEGKQQQFRILFPAGTDGTAKQAL